MPNRVREWYNTDEFFEVIPENGATTAWIMKQIRCSRQIANKYLEKLIEENRVKQFKAEGSHDVVWMRC